MGILRFNYRSQAINRYVDISIVYPTDNFSYYDMSKGARHNIGLDQKEKGQYVSGMKFQTIYLIHGGGDDDSLVYRYTNAERFAQDNNVMLVTPDISNSFGVDTKYGVDYSTFLTKELPVVIQSLFASSPKREDNFILGYAMGGNVALGNSLMHPELYNTCIDISGGIGLTVNTKTLKNELEGDHFKNNFKLYNETFGEADKLDDSKYNMLSIAKENLEKGKEVPKYYLIAGSEEPDMIRERVEEDAKTMKRLGYDVTYICEEGHKHDFKLWDKYIEIAIEKLLPLKRKPILP